MDTHRVAFVERLTELLQGVEELDVVLGLIGEVGDGHVQLLPGLMQERGILKWAEGRSLAATHLQHLGLSSHQHIDDCSALGALDTGSERVKLGHTLLPML